MGVLDAVLADERGVLLVRELPALVSSIKKAYQKGLLFRVLDGVYVPKGRENEIALLREPFVVVTQMR